jgi:glycosyltransferase involved in cell wall biosynthesis
MYSSIFHISLTPFLFESRVLKEIKTVSNFNFFKKIYVIALHTDDLSKIERIGTHAILIRIKLKSRLIPILRKISPLIYFELFLRLFFLIIKKPKSVLSIHVIDLLPIAAFLNFFCNIPVIYDTHELEPFTSNNRFKIFILKNIESIFVRFVSCIIVVNDSIKDLYQKRFPQKKVYSVYNAPNLQYPKNNGTIRKILDLKTEDKIFLYQGGLVQGRGIEILLEAFAFLPDKSCKLVFVGYGALEAKIQKYVLEFSNIYFLNAVSPDKLLEYTASCDFGISLIENSCLSYYYCLPNKVLEYLMCRKPILVSNLKEMSSLVGNNRIGVVAQDFTITEVREGIIKLKSLDLAVTKQNIDVIIDKYSWERQEVKLLEAYHYVLNTKKW